MHLGDAVGVVARSGVPDADLYYHAEAALVKRAFEEAFTEVVFMPGWSEVAPKWGAPSQELITSEFSHKWFNQRANSIAGNNIIHLIGGWLDASKAAYGVTRLQNAFGEPSNVSIVYARELVAGGFSSLSANRKVTVHEAAHHFGVNLNDAGKHCASPTHFDVSRKCVMHGDDYDQFNNNTAAFDADASSPASRTGKGDIYDIRFWQEPIH